MVTDRRPKALLSISQDVTARDLSVNSAMMASIHAFGLRGSNGGIVSTYPCRSRTTDVLDAVLNAIKNVTSTLRRRLVGHRRRRRWSLSGHWILDRLDSDNLRWPTDLTHD